MCRWRLRRESGFTLTELMVVVAAIAILIALLMPTIATARERASTVECMSRERVLVQSLSAYAALNRGKYPPNAATPAPGWFWNDTFVLGINSDLTFVKYSPDVPGQNVGTSFTCPKDRSSARTYAMNYWASSLVVILGSAAKATNIKRGMFWNAAVRRGDRMILVSETWSGTTTENGIYSCPSTIGYMGDDPASRFGASGGITPYSVPHWGTVNCELAYVLHRVPSHNGGTAPIGQVNIAFADGHVATQAYGNLVNQAGQLTGTAYWSPLDYWTQ